MSSSPVLEIPHTVDMERRFGGVARLYGAKALARFQNARVCIAGIGGVGSWSAEAIARSGIGHITLIDLDNIHESNMNRQIHALETELGRAKVATMAERILAINPLCQITQIEDFVAIDNIADLITAEYDCVIDAIDSVKVKAALIAHCVRNRIALVTVGSAGGKADPTRIQAVDLSRTEQDPLLAKVRRLLRKEYGFPRERRHKFRIEAISSDEPVKLPDSPRSCSTEPEEIGLEGLNCAGLGSSVCVTATFGLVAASRALATLASKSE
jgi:tRNA A37 threonylcarbamoyladenosine dehydratase